MACAHGGGLFHLFFDDVRMNVCAIARCRGVAAAIPVATITGESCACAAVLHIARPVCARHMEWDDPLSRDAWNKILITALKNGVHIATPITHVKVDFVFMM